MNAIRRVRADRPLSVEKPEEAAYFDQLDYVDLHDPMAAGVSLGEDDISSYSEVASGIFEHQDGVYSLIAWNIPFYRIVSVVGAPHTGIGSGKLNPDLPEDFRESLENAMKSNGWSNIRGSNGKIRLEGRAHKITNDEGREATAILVVILIAEGVE